MVILFCKCSGKNFGTLCHTNGAIKCQSSASYVCLTGRGSYVGNVAIAYQRKFCDLKKGGPWNSHWKVLWQWPGIVGLTWWRWHCLRNLLEHRRIPKLCPDLLCSTWNPDEDFSKKDQKKAATKVRLYSPQGCGSSCDLPLYWKDPNFNFKFWIFYCSIKTP